jgi:hypothetical protein
MDAPQKSKNRTCSSHMWNIDLIQTQKYYEEQVTLMGGHLQEG